MRLVAAQAANVADARAKLLQVESVLREADVASGGGHTAAADMAYLYSATDVWFTAERNFTGGVVRFWRSAV
jgi:hypothetical protein